MGATHRITVEVDIDPAETHLRDVSMALHRAADVVSMMTMLPEGIKLGVIAFDGVPDATITYADVRPKYVPF